MNEFTIQSAAFGVVVSIAGYELGVWLRKKFPNPLVNPILIAVIFVICFLSIFGIKYENYEASAKYISYLLTPATVCLAIPLYQKLQLLKENLVAVLAGIISGVLTSLGSVLGLSALLGLSHEEYVTLLPKSITTAIGMGISEELGGIVTVTVVVIIFTGILGNVFAELFCKWFRIKSPIARGVAIGTSAHALGTAKALEMGEIEGAMSSLSIVVAGLCTTIGAAFFANLL